MGWKGWSCYLQTTYTVTTLATVRTEVILMTEPAEPEWTTDPCGYKEINNYHCGN